MLNAEFIRKNALRIQEEQEKRFMGAINALVDQLVLDWSEKFPFNEEYHFTVDYNLYPLGMLVSVCESRGFTIRFDGYKHQKADITISI